MLLQPLEGLGADVVLYTAGVLGGLGLGDAQLGEPEGEKAVALVDPLGDLPAGGGELQGPVGVHGQVALLPKELYRPADAGLGVAKAVGHVDGADEAFFIFQDQDSLQIVLCRFLDLHRAAPLICVQPYLTTGGRKRQGERKWAGALALFGGNRYNEGTKICKGDPAMVQPHIQLDESLNIKYAILPGDPARVSRIAEQMEKVEELGFNREYRALRGTYQGVPVLAMSTGMGGASMAIAVEELKNIGVTHIIRIGSAGALQEGIALGDLILVEGAVRDDGASRIYAPDSYPGVADHDLLAACIRAGREKGFRCHVGLCRSHDSFYIDNNEDISAAWSKRGVLGSDMETAALFTVARLRGVKAASILNNVVIWGEDTSESIGSYADGASLTAQGERDEITVALEAFVRIEKGETV